MKLTRSLLFLPLILTISFSLNDPGKWSLKKNKDGIAVYTRYPKNSNIKEIWMVDTVQSTLSAVVAILLDTKNYPLWVYHCAECTTLSTISKQEEYDYELTSVPFPFNNRDIITDTKVAQDSITKVVTITSTNAPDYIPYKDKTVRITQFHSVYTLTKLKNGNVEVSYTAFGDPGGNIPDWLINANIVVGPYNCALGMNKRLPLYQSVTYSFIKE